MDFLTTILAQFFDRLKIKSPKLAAVILLILGFLAWFADQGTLLGLFSLPTWASEAVKYIALFLAAVTGTRTTRYLPSTTENTAKPSGK